MTDLTGTDGSAAPRAALFDLDGTLINSEPRSLATWARLLDAHNVPYDDELLHRFMGRRGQDVFAEYPDLIPDITLDVIIAELRVYGADPGLPPVEHLPESVKFLQRLHAAEVPFGLVTSAGLAWAETALTELGVRELFGPLVTAGDVTEGKPDPQGYLRGAELLGHDPEHIVVFEDTPAGIEAGRRAGMRVIGITTTHPPATLSRAHRVVEHLTEVDWPDVLP
ncbi:HAD family hydrolase [Marinitenerispora sediminis]|uniref:HAD family hydrolase n=1 Tax=Marinitenerispora sediminis TaxID=1931232 RepID=A0A368T6X6_9ACTN|nr:HAD family phosphatase [Marinitenerispora sediminis]RCV55713.1 HAD family hydrolase [Marinitenerispora sediminis]RCV56734.1 HAD family hydrolase [Marinitenerispora sediminis]RCV56763.1 HAD family hydrolase [Marinitenerispora sediminis]